MPNWNLTQCSTRWCSLVYEGVSVTNGVLHSPDPIEVEVAIDSNRVCNESLCQQLVTTDSSKMPNGVNTNYELVLNTAAADIAKLLNFDYDIYAYANGTWDSSSVFSMPATMFLNIDISAAIAKLCTAFANRLRSDDPVNIMGTVLVTTTAILIRWAWLILPIILASCAICFVILVIIVTLRRRQFSWAMWKDSSLPLLYHPLVDDHDATIYQPPETRTAMREESRSVYAQLRQKSDGTVAFFVVDQ